MSIPKLEFPPFHLPAEAEALNLDRADAFFTAMRELRAAAAA